ncbi:Krr1-domain-containing protein [Tilletiaria anomala UBC 951]|uniref:Krr1-domain-containing protein n=1 Tax=Tilletiaria anomala (strain ATCC 24038 / CBS 436.72 / UBC 951) TaxID=1037660 RepID=A0A066WK25_TILAU|nr:Krr1-domain-containing protein [Tilletiaria anomala UBC 951]KDN51354.1 Krr1-domain-containing protein [Tilletiaria anomala UBC 951]
MLSDSNKETKNSSKSSSGKYSGHPQHAAATSKGSGSNRARQQMGSEQARSLSSESDTSTESESETDETEDEDGEQVTADVDAAILRTLAKIRRKDGDIYNADKKIFDDERAKLASIPAPTTLAHKPTSSNKKITLQDYQRSRIQEALASDASGDAAARALAEATTNPTRLGHHVDYDSSGAPRTYAQEEEDLRREVLAAFHGDVEDDEGGDDDGGGVFQKRGGGVGDDDEDGTSYRSYILRALGGDEDAVRDVLRERAEAVAKEGIILAGNDGDESAVGSNKETGQKKEGEKGKEKARKNGKAQEEADHEFLMNYILNRGWLENDDASVPARKRKSKSGDKNSEVAQAHDERDWDAEAADLESEASFDSRASAFETAYNFRYEALESGAASGTIPTFSRDAAAVGSVRRDEKREKRKEKREERRKRKDTEKAEKMKMLEKAKERKTREIMEKLKKLKEATGSDAVGFEDLDLEAEFDPSAHDRAMEAAFNDDYYAEEDMQFNSDGKPIWNDDIDIGDIDGEEEGPYDSEQAVGAVWGADDEDGRIEMDADFLEGKNGGEQAPDTSKLSKKERKKLKKKEKKRQQQSGDQADSGVIDEAEMDAENAAKQQEDERQALRKLPPAERKKKVSEMLDEYYSMDYEDMIGDLPTRFKYVQVPKSNYGLSPVEILLADDNQLNNVVGIKQIQPYRRGSKRPADLGRRLREFRKDFNTGLGPSGSAHGRHTHGQGSEHRAQQHAGKSGDGQEQGKTKRAGKKERQKLKRAGDGDGAGGEGATAGATEQEERQAKRPKLKNDA